MPDIKESFVRATPYERRIELPYCCVPAVLQMVLERRRLPVPEQESIGNELGLIVPEDAARHFGWVRTGQKPQSGWGTQTRLEEFSIQRYFNRHHLPLQIVRYLPGEISNLQEALVSHLEQNNDVVLVVDQRKLVEQGDEEHVVLVQGLDGESVLLVDPAKTRPDLCTVSLVQLTEAIVEVWSISGKEILKSSSQQTP